MHNEQWTVNPANGFDGLRPKHHHNPRITLWNVTEFFDVLRRRNLYMDTTLSVPRNFFPFSEGK